MLHQVLELTSRASYGTIAPGSLGGDALYMLHLSEQPGSPISLPQCHEKRIDLSELIWTSGIINTIVVQDK